MVGGLAQDVEIDKLSLRLKFNEDLRYPFMVKTELRGLTPCSDHRLNNVWHYNRGESQRARAGYTHDQFLLTRTAMGGLFQQATTFYPI